jgi:hypothetical protein
MEIKKSLNIVEHSDKYSDWKEKNKNTFLAHVFAMFDAKNENILQFGYYNSDNDKITTFIVEGEMVSMSAESEIFKRDDHVMKELEMEKVKLTLDQAKDIMKEFQENKYPREKPNNSFMILQHLEHGNVYNFTYVTAAFNMLNAKIDSSTGEILDSQLNSLMDIGSFDK